MSGMAEVGCSRSFKNIKTAVHARHNIRVERRGRHALQDGGRHARYLKPYAFLAECVYKFSERRKFSCIRQRSSGVAPRLLANRIFSSSVRLTSSASRRFLMAWNFFLLMSTFY